MIRITHYRKKIHFYYFDRYFYLDINIIVDNSVTLKCLTRNDDSTARRPFTRGLRHSDADRAIVLHTLFLLNKF